MTHRRIAGLLAVCVLVVSAVVGCTSRASTPKETVAAQAFLDAVGRGDYAKAGAATTDQTAAIGVIKAFVSGLAVAQPHGAAVADADHHAAHVVGGAQGTLGGPCLGRPSRGSTAGSCQ